MTESTVPLLDVPEAARERLLALGATEESFSSKLYRALANEPDLLIGWLELAWRLRQDRKTSTRLRELMIVRGAQLSDCEFELIGHQIRARAAGVTADELDEVAAWESSQLFSEQERLAFAFMEESVTGKTSDATLAALSQAFDPAERIELVLTASFYCMVPRVVDALRLVRDKPAG